MEIKKLVVGPLSTNAYLIISDNEAGLIDPGGNLKEILTEIEKRKLKLKYIINTHYHPDHTACNELIKEKTKAQILIHKDEKTAIDFKPDRFLEDGDKIKIGNLSLKVLHTPGHTKGSICLVGKDFIFTGDTLFQFGYGRTDLAGGSNEEMRASLSKLFRVLSPGMVVYPGHGQEFIWQGKPDLLI